MRRGLYPLMGLCVGLLVSTSVFAGQIAGDYIETRSADVYTGPCFANGEVGLTGNEATLAWKIRRGAWDGVNLDGLSIVAVARASATLGDPYHNPYPAQAVLIVDQNASMEQKAALANFAKTMGGRLLENVIRIDSAPISFQVGEAEHHGSARVVAGKLAFVETRSLGDKDHFCGNETTYYPPLTELAHAMPAFSLANEYLGNSLGAEWRIFDKRSAFVGTFDR
jgi:hypothetical protein